MYAYTNFANILLKVDSCGQHFEISEVGTKKKCASISIKSDITKDNALALQAETEQVFSILHMFNTLKQLVQRKKDQLAELEKGEKA